MDVTSYFIAVMLYGLSLEAIYLVSKRGAWMFMIIVTAAIMMSYPNFANEILYFAGGAKRVAKKGQSKPKGKRK